ncbi:hypothetical protein [Shewanella sp.]|uniref:hypothetical protein n=1 Tax=Shewanella sp. TaxID=50422 RepID=UPI004053C531
MKLVSDTDYIEISVLEESNLPQNLGDIRLSVKICLSGFVGEYNQVWIEATEKNRFISSLVKFEETRSGSVNIESMSPNEFMLDISAIDSLGHLQVEILLSKYSRGVNRGSDLVSLSGGFEFDPVSFPLFVEEFCAYAN